MNRRSISSEGVRASRDALLAVPASAPTVSRSASAVPQAPTRACLAPSRIRASSPDASTAPLAARMPLLRPSQVPVELAWGDSVDMLEKTSPVLEVVGKGGGQPLAPQLRADMESGLGDDFSDVRIHTDAKAVRSAAAVSAEAYTMGNEIVFGHGSFVPDSPVGRHRLVHELAHVQQQRKGRVSGTDTGRGVAVSDPSDFFEQEAQATASRVLSSSSQPVAGNHAPPDGQASAALGSGSADNRAVCRPLMPGVSSSARLRHVQRQTAQASMDPKDYASYGDWLQSLPADAIDYTSVNVTGKVAAALPELASLVTDLHADCADVTLLLKHFYLQAHGQSQTIKSIDPHDSTKTVNYKLGAGVSRNELRKALIYLGTVSFQEKGRSRLAFVNYYGGSNPLKNLKEIINAGLTAGDVLVWKRLPGIHGNFSGHVQTVQRVYPYASVPPGYYGPESKGGIQVLQGTMEAGVAKEQIQSRLLEFSLLTGRDDGDGPITFQPDSEEEFYGAGKW